MERLKYNIDEYNELVKAISISTTFREFLINLGRSESSASYRYVKRRLLFYNLNTSHFLTKSEILKIKHKKLRPSNEEMFTKDSKSSRGAIKKRIINEKLIPYKCSICANEGIWRNQKMTLILDHIDGDSRNNDLSNLRFVCPNCNSMLDTHCVGKKGVGKIKTDIKKRSEYFTNRDYKPRIEHRKVVRPTKNELMVLLKETSFCAIGRKYGVSDNAVRKWAKQYGIL